MKEKSNWIIVGTVGLVIVIFVAALITKGWCLVKYWNTPYLQVPMICHSSS